MSDFGVKVITGKGPTMQDAADRASEKANAWLGMHRLKAPDGRSHYQVGSSQARIGDMFYFSLIFTGDMTKTHDIEGNPIC